MNSKVLAKGEGSSRLPVTQCRFIHHLGLPALTSTQPVSFAAISEATHCIEVSLEGAQTRQLQESPARLSSVADGKHIKTTEYTIEDSIRQISNGHARHTCFPAVHPAIKFLVSQES